MFFRRVVYQSFIVRHILISVADTLVAVCSMPVDLETIDTTATVFRVVNIGVHLAHQIRNAPDADTSLFRNYGRIFSIGIIVSVHSARSLLFLFPLYREPVAALLHDVSQFMSQKLTTLGCFRCKLSWSKYDMSAGGEGQRTNVLCRSSCCFISMHSNLAEIGACAA